MLLLVAIALALVGSSALAQSGGAPRLLNGDVPILPDGVLIFAYDLRSQQLNEQTIVVTDGAEAVVPGRIEDAFLDTGPIATPSPTMFWRPAEPFAAGKRFKVDTTDSSGETRAFVIEIAAEPSDHVILDEQWLAWELRASAADRGEHTACCENEEKPSRCFAPHLVLVPEVQITVDGSESSSLLRQLFFQPRSTDPQDAMTASFWYDRTMALPAVPFRGESAEYCVVLSIYNAATRQSEAIERCIPNEPGLLEDTVPKDPENIAAALAVGGCMRPPEGFEDAWCESNRQTCFKLGWEGCEHFDELCPDYPREPHAPGSDTGIVDERDAGSDAGMSSSGSGSGCGCKLVASSATNGHHLMWLAPLVLLALRRARRVGDGITRS